MSEQHFEVVFRGDVEPGRSVAEVKEGLSKLFNTESSRIDQMFSGKPVVIKANIDEQTALHYQASLKKVGALVDVRPSGSANGSALSTNSTQNTSTDVSEHSDTSAVGESQQHNSDETEEMENFDFDVAPIGADVLTAEHKKDYTPADVDTSHLTVSEAGSDVLEDKDKRSYDESDVDTSHLSIDAMEDPE